MPPGLRSAAVQAASLIVFLIVPAALTVSLFAVGGDAFAYDFHQAFWPAGRDVLHGVTPYVDATSPDVAEGIAFIYPAVAAFLLAPFALLGHAVADVVFAALNVGAVALTLRLLGVRDWRLYGFVLICPAVVYGWHLANVTLLILLAVAAVWRWRESRFVCGVLVAVLISVKLFVWPLALWLLATRRYASIAYALAAGVAVNIAAWAVLGIDQIGPYQRLLQAAARMEQGDGYSAVAVGLRFGTGAASALVLAGALTAVGVAVCAALGQAGRERQAMVACVGTCLVASPVVWLPYFALLIVPLALVRPRMDGAWWVLLPMWACPIVDPAGWQLMIALACAVTLVVLSVRAPGRGPRVARTGSASLAGIAGAIRALVSVVPRRHHQPAG